MLAQMFFRSKPNGWPPQSPTTIPEHVNHSLQRESLDMIETRPYLSQPNAKPGLRADGFDEDGDLPIHRSEILPQPKWPSVLERLIDRQQHDTFEDVDLERGHESDMAERIRGSQHVAVTIRILVGLFLVILVGGLLFLSHQQ